MEKRGEMAKKKKPWQEIYNKIIGNNIEKQATCNGSFAFHWSSTPENTSRNM